MSNLKKNRFYWLKLHKDFFKQHEIRIIESMDNGKDYILFYLKLLVESVSHEGMLRFSDVIPYNEQMLASITNTNVDVVRSAMKIFQELHMIDVLDDKTIYMTEVEEMIGSEGASAKWMRDKRARDKSLEITTESQSDKEIRDKRIDNNIYVSPEDDTEEIDKNFEIIYSRYPVKGTKASAKESYKKWIQKSGRKVGGKTYHLTNKQIWAAVDNYVKTQEAKGTDTKYYKNFVTLMNQILDWVVEEGEN